MHPSLPELMNLFVGYKKAYGIYKLTGERTAEGKALGRAASKIGEVTVELWTQHLIGKQGLGIIPINEDSEVRFAAIDIDQYPLDIVKLCQRISEAKLPLVACRTKSGGAHLFMFLSKFCSATVVQSKMREMASFLGYGTAEIFPKQTKIIVERGDVGQWINMPYFNVSHTMRWAHGPDGKQLDLPQFVEYAMSLQITPEQLETLGTHPEEILEGGPPCLQHLVKLGFPPGTRNNGLFNLGVYYRKKDPDNWQRMVEEANQKFMDPPLTTIEVLGVIKSIGKKEFSYMCEQPPIKQFCNAPLCRGCRFGIGGIAAGFPKFGSLTKLDTDPPIWFLEVEGGGRLELQTTDLQQPIRFQHRCMEALNIMPALPKADIWRGIVVRLLADVAVIDVPKDATPLGQLLQHLEDFCTSRVQGKSHDELLIGKPWTNDHKTYFRLRDFVAYLDRQKFKDFSLAHITMHLRDFGAEKGFFNIRGKGVNYWMIPAFESKQTEPFEVPLEAKKTPF